MTVQAGRTTNVTATYNSAPIYTLAVESLYGTPVPAAGSHDYLENSAVTCSIGGSPVTSGTTQRVCVGWTRTGSSPGAGSTLSSAFSMTAHTTHTWLWRTNHYLAAAAGGAGSVSTSGGWYRSVSNAAVTATPIAGYAFNRWTGDVPSAQTNANPVSLPMDRPRSVTALFAPIAGQTAVWTNTANGTWATLGNWLSSQKPGPGTNADINANGTYVSTANFGGVAVRHIELGTRSTSGTQTLDIGNSALSASNVTVGARGVLLNADNGTINGGGLITVRSGGTWRKTGGTGGGIGSHSLQLDAGGRWTVGSTGSDKYTVVGSAATYTINGVVDGPGGLDLNEKNNRVVWTGTGQINVASITLNNNNGYAYLGGSLTIGAAFTHGAAANNRSILLNGADITFNGTFSHPSGNARVLVLDDGATSATVRGTNLISVSASGGNTAVFTGYPTSDGGTLTVAGSGTLLLSTRDNGTRIQLRGQNLNLQRNTTLAGDVYGGYIKKEVGGTIAVAGSGVTLAISTNAILVLDGQDRLVRVNAGAVLRMEQGNVRGSSNGTVERWNIRVGQGSAATFALATGASKFAKESTNPMWALLDSNTTVTAASTGRLNVENTRFAVAIKDGAAWGLRTAGTVGLGSGAIVEALSTDKGRRQRLVASMLYLNELRVYGSVDVALTLANDGAADNDGDGTTDSAIYVKKLDLSEMQAGTTVTLAAAAGSGIATPVVYYGRLVNPNNVARGPGFYRLQEEGTVFVLR